MAIRKIAHLGHPVLREKAREVTPDEIQTPAFQQLIDDLIETMRDANGAGLAAPQIYESIRLCAIEVINNPRYPYKPNIPLTVLVNPRIEPLTDETFENFEGCLSVPNLRGRVRRFAEVRVAAFDRHGERTERTVKGFTAGTYQHEVDHLDATIFTDRLTDSRSLTTWTEFERHHRAAWLEEATRLIERFGE